MDLFDWFRRAKAIQLDSVPRRSKELPTGFVTSSDSQQKIYLNVDMTGPGELMFVGPDSEKDGNGQKLRT